jgi:hypothetical protein
MQKWRSQAKHNIINVIMFLASLPGEPCPVDLGLISLPGQTAQSTF